MDSGVDIVPVAIIGSHEIMPRGAALIKAGTVRLEVGEPIPTAGLKSADRDALIEKVRGRVAAMLGETGETGETAETGEPGKPGAPSAPNAAAT